MGVPASVSVFRHDSLRNVVRKTRTLVLTRPVGLYFLSLIPHLYPLSRIQVLFPIFKFV